MRLATSGERRRHFQRRIALVAGTAALAVTSLGAAVRAPHASGRAAPQAAPSATTPRPTTPGAAAGPAVSDRGLAPSAPAPVAIGGVRCILQLHGLGGSGGPTVVASGIVKLSPSGGLWTANGLGWEYRSDAILATEATRLQSLVETSSCGQVVLAGFSNGGAMAVRLLCRGVTFGGRLRAVILDDAVLDSASSGCASSSTVGTRIMLVSDWMAAKGTEGGPCEPGWICLGNRRPATTVGVSVSATPMLKPEGHVMANDYVELAAGVWR